MQVTNNHVLILPDGEYDKLSSLELKTFVNSHNHQRVTGKVVAVPEKIEYVKLKFDPDASLSDQEAYSALNEMAIATQEVDVTLEVKVGDTVMFRHIHLLVDDEQNDFVEIDGVNYLLIPYSSLICRVEDFYPLNGYVFIEVPGVDDYLRGRVKSLSKGIVRASGCIGKHYRHYPDYVDGPIPVGSEVAFLFNQAIVLENSMHITTESEFPLLRIHRPEILAIKN